MPKQAVLTIYIPKQGFISQGKYCLIDDKPCFVANMDDNKLFGKREGSNWPYGYAIARRILENLPKKTLIIFKRVDLDTYYTSTISNFKKRGILVNFGGHSQLILPLLKWTPVAGKLLNEPHQLPVISLDKWIKNGAGSSPVLSAGPIQDYSIPTDVMLRLKKVWVEKYA